jgi:hypothetical protein
VETDRTSDRSSAFTVGISRRAALGRLAWAGIAAGLLTGWPRKYARAQSTPASGLDQWNTFRLSDAETRIGYATTSEIGVPMLTYDGPFGSHRFEADEIVVEESALGRLVTVDLGGFPDQGNLTLTLLLPAFNPVDADDPPATFATLAILKWVISTIAGPPREGALEEYDVVPLEGTAELLYY